MEQPNNIQGMIPIRVDAWDQAETFSFMFEGQMVETFGPWEKDDIVTLWVDFEKGEVCSYHQNGELEYKFQIKAEIVDAVTD